MNKYDLSILIPARNEMFLKRTVEDILSNIEGNTEIIIVLDGAWADPPVPQHERVTIIHHNQSIGQRAATNEAARLSSAKYLMKVDAHCAFDKGFDVKMMNEMHDDWTMVPLMKNHHAFDWVCPDGHRRYQGPSGKCTECGKETTRDVVWIAKKSPNSVSYCFDSTPHFQYFGEFSKRPEGQGDVTPSMSLQGSCFMLTREKYWELSICDESFGSWGSQGIEVAVKTWLSGGSVMVNKKTWYAHMFRTQGGDFGFPYPLSGRATEKAKMYARDLFFNNKWEKQVRPLSWLVEKFWPVKGWTDEDLKKLKSNTFKFSENITKSKSEETEIKEFELSTSGIIYQSVPPTKGIIYYTDNTLKVKIASRVQRQIAKVGLPIVSASLKPMAFGSNIYLPNLERGPLTMFKQILAALENSKSDIVFFCEHDVLYHPSHFDFTPQKRDIWYYNENIWRLDSKTGHAIYDNTKKISEIAVWRETALSYFKKKVATIEKDEFNIDDLISESWKSLFPNINIKQEEFISRDSIKGIIESDDEIPGWGKTIDLVNKFN